ncbi:MAG: glycine cleavage system aminomethyltransferase GcvT [Candidatus Omnitrophica bacterium]|nr:glycine cleavage system aminomethyltransferase GcvT [Candidatus Omnitrophota bacterium]
MKLTPLIEEHRKAGAKLAPFGGWLMPIQYTGIIAEHQWTRSSCALFDICHMGEFIIEGDAQETNFENIVTLSPANMPLNTCRYGFMLNEQGGVIDDVIVYRIGRDKWMMVVNAGTIESDEQHLRQHLSPKARLENVSASLAKLDIQGPRSGMVMKKIAGEAIAGLRYYTFDYFSFLGQKNIISRTGYTGELGYEVYIAAEKVNELWNVLLLDSDVKPAGLGARDTLRLEVGYPLYGQDIDHTSTPLEAGLAAFVDFNKEFIGKEALLKQKQAALKRGLSCFITDSRRAARHNYAVYSGDKQIGVVTSGSFSPSLSRGIGMAYISPEYGVPGTPVTLRQGTVEIQAMITEKPFYKNGTARGLTE